jgi:hypothetical protein
MVSTGVFVAVPAASLSTGHLSKKHGEAVAGVGGDADA